MSDETESKASLQPLLSARDQNDDLAGASILTLPQRSADMAEGNSQYAVGLRSAPPGLLTQWLDTSGACETRRGPRRPDTLGPLES
jgi:hypothetical protein